MNLLDKIASANPVVHVIGAALFVVGCALVATGAYLLGWI
jgi:hypothetical protein